MTKRLRYQVAPTLDGFTAGPNGENDWIVSDAAIDFTALDNEGERSRPPGRLQRSDGVADMIFGHRHVPAQFVCRVHCRSDRVQRRPANWPNARAHATPRAHQIPRLWR
jgi:hypothetical protein